MARYKPLERVSLDSVEARTRETLALQRYLYRRRLSHDAAITLLIHEIRELLMVQAFRQSTTPSQRRAEVRRSVRAVQKALSQVVEANLK